MKLSDVVSAMHVSIFAQLPLLMFFGIFIGVVMHVTLGKNQFEHARRLPLESDKSPGERQR